MSLIKTGSFNDITLSLTNVSFRRGIRKFPEVISSRAVKELAADVQPPALDLKKSDKNWSLYLKSISLYESFEGLLNIFKPKNELYFTCIAWDYSGEKPIVYPPQSADPASLMIPMKEGKTREFIGNGVCLWPARSVVGCLNIILVVYECDSDVRATGERLVEIHEVVEKSSLASLILAISGNPAMVTGVAVGAAVTELIGVIGNIMKKDGDDYVDLFSGSYGTEKEQAGGVTKYDHESAGIELDFVIS